MGLNQPHFLFVSIAEDIFSLQFDNGAEFLQGIHIEFLLITQNGVIISAVFYPLLLEIDNILQGHALDVIIQLTAGIDTQAQFLRIDERPDNRFLGNAFGTQTGIIPSFAKLKAASD